MYPNPDNSGRIAIKKQAFPMENTSPQASKTELTFLPSSVGFYELSGPLQVPLTITATAGNKSLGQIVVPSTLRGQIDFATLDVYLGLISNTYASGDNTINGDQYIQMKVGAASYSNAILMPTGTLGVGAASAKANGYWVRGAVDVSSLFTKGNTIDVQWTSARAQQISIILSNFFSQLNIYTRL